MPNMSDNMFRWYLKLGFELFKKKQIKPQNLTIISNKKTE